ncbi:hypothetical protein JCM16303_002505 [Sporobolomyces ruberrimus]
MFSRPHRCLHTVLQSRTYSVASKARRTKPALTFPSPSSSASPTPLKGPLDASPAAAPSTIGSSTLAKHVGGIREPPLVEAARKKSVKQRNVFESYLVLSWRTRLYFWVAIGIVAVAGLYGGDYIVPETDEEKAAKGETPEA